jgi:sorting nexin-1/2
MDVEESPWADSSQTGKQPASQDAEPASQDTASAATPSTSQPAASSTASSRPSRGPRRLVAQPTRLEAVDDPLGPLGAATPPAGDGALSKDDEPPAPPLKEQMVIRTTMSQQQQQQRRPIDPHHIDDDDEEGEGDGRRGPRAPPPVEAARPTGLRSNTQPSVSVEQAAKPTFQIYVGDPVKIGDLTSSHIVYSVRTKVIILSLISVLLTGSCAAR